jgi:8-oxo-dGTP diphosphatase
LPGGHVELGESMPNTLERELKEELDLTIHVVRYIGAVEHSYGEPREYEINHVFAASCKYQGLNTPRVQRRPPRVFVASTRGFGSA